MFKKFLDKLRPDKDEDDTIKVKGKVKPKYYGTVAPYPDFNASSDASVLWSAIKDKDVDEDVINAILVKRNNEQRQKIKAVYEAMNGSNLEKDLKEVLRSDLEDVVLALLMTPAHFDAWLLRKATKCLGTDEEILVEILTTRTNQEIRDIERLFQEEYGLDLVQVIEGETSGHFHDALQVLLKANKDESHEVDMDLARKDAQTLLENGEEAGDISEATFINILTSRSGPQLRETLKIYKNDLGEISLPKLIQRELSGDIEDCLIALVKNAWNMPAFFAEKLHRALEHPNTCEETLIRILVGRSEIDLKKIVEEYRAMYGISLQEAIQRETKGHYQGALLSLCGPH